MKFLRVVVALSLLTSAIGPNAVAVARETSPPPPMNGYDGRMEPEMQRILSDYSAEIQSATLEESIAQSMNSSDPSRAIQAQDVKAILDETQQQLKKLQLPPNPTDEQKQKALMELEQEQGKTESALGLSPIKKKKFHWYNWYSKLLCLKSQKGLWLFGAFFASVAAGQLYLAAAIFLDLNWGIVLGLWELKEHC